MTNDLDRRVLADPRRRWFLAGLVVIVMGAAIAAYVFEHKRGGQHGTPDPGGHRLTAVESLAQKMAPAVAVDVRISQHGFRWDPETCDGQAPGWSNADVDITFRAPSSLPASLDALMRQLDWMKDKPGAPSSGPAPAAPWPDFRTYVPDGRDPYGEAASLVPPSTYGGGLWDLDISASPAEVPSHDC